MKMQCDSVMGYLVVYTAGCFVFFTCAETLTNYMLNASLRNLVNVAYMRSGYGAESLVAQCLVAWNARHGGAAGKSNMSMAEV